MIDTRRKQFYLGRSAAHNAISSLLGQNKTPILKRKRREPIWPEGFFGVITHTGKIAIAAVGRKEHTCGVGSDLEQISNDYFR